MACGFVVVTGVVVTHLDRVIPPDRLFASIAIGFVAAFGLMAGSARIFVRDAQVYVVSFLFTFVVPVDEIVALKADNGFGIQVVSGRVIDSMAFGSSLITEFTGNRRGRRAARRLTDLCGPFTAILASDLTPGARHRAGGLDATSTKIRLGMLFLAGSLVAAAAVAAAIQDAPVHL
jgi:small basic protein